MRISLLALSLLLLVTGCSLPRKAQQEQTTQEQVPQVKGSTGTPGSTWTTRQEGSLSFSQLVYSSDNLRIAGLVCAPRPLKPGTPLIMLEHGGFDTPPDAIKCRQYARKGYVIAQSAYRGQGTSEGKVEACLGEVNDSLTLKRLVQQKLQTRGVVHVGVSLGGCIAIKAASQATDVQGVAVLVTPMDFAQQIAILRRTRPDALDRWFQVFGGSPEEVPQNYQQRSPLQAASTMKAPLLALIAAQDPLIPYQQQCDLLQVRQKAGKKPTVVHLAKDGTARPPLQERYVCAGSSPQGTLPAFKDQDVFVTYYNLHHTSTAHMWNTVEQFIRQRLPLP